MSTSKSNRWLWLGFLFYFLSLVVYAIFSYSLTAPNLVLSQNHYFWQFQTYMWRTFFNNRELLAQTYLGLMVTTFSSYLFFASQLIRRQKLSLKLIYLLLILLIVPLFFSNNALSYDVFNYIFNAKMVAVYHVDPHVSVAQNFPDDPWTKFMHNVHTPAPYGYGWTYLSLIPFTLGLGKFVLTWLSFRLFSVLPLFFLAYLFWHYNRQSSPWWLILVVFNPLVLIEVVSNSHNDLWMMSLAVWAILYWNQHRTKPHWVFKGIFSLFLLAISMWIKLASVVLLPIWVLILLKPKLKSVPRFNSLIENAPFLASLAMFAPLLTARSQQFHPWYLLWPLTFVPLVRNNRLINVWCQALLVLSISSMFRYLPFLWHNNYEGDVLLWQKMITFVPFVMALVWFGKNALLQPSKTKK